MIKELQGLNPAQQSAVLHQEGPLLVVAGAGSGKTRVLTLRIANLIDEGKALPEEILAITFTNKAAQEMRDRIASQIGPVGKNIWVSTFHSACARILRSEASHLGYRPSFSIYDSSDTARLVGYAINELNLDTKRFSPKSIAAQISAAKNELIDFESYAKRAEGIFERKISDIYRLYQQKLLQANAMDFDDLVMLVVHLFQSNSKVLQRYQRRFRHLLVDEYQDTNMAQNELVFLLGSEHQNVCVVGDADQSIYRFRGADIRNILEFEKIFPATKTIYLEQNYRSSATILKAANAVIENNFGRKPKQLWTEKQDGDLIDCYIATDERDEAAWVVSRISSLCSQDSYSYSDFAIFYRANAQSRSIEEELVRQKIPYRLIGGTRFYDRREIKDLLSYLRLASNESDEVALRRIINVPKRGLGETSIRRLADFASANKQSLYWAIQNYSEAGLSSRVTEGLGHLSRLLYSLANNKVLPPAELLDYILHESGYSQALVAEGPEGALRMENVSELIGVARNYPDLEEFLESVSLISDTDDLDNTDSKVSLMTLHAAKGLEFPFIFLIGFEEGLFPHSRSFDNPHELEEERRLCYVGITRAKEKVFLSLANERNLWGSFQHNPPSRFLAEIPKELVKGLETPARSQRSNLEGYSLLSTLPKKKKTTPVWTKGAEKLNLGVGDDVVHTTWGEGVVVGIYGSGDKAEISVSFPGKGEKRLLLAYAPLKRA